MLAVGLIGAGPWARLVHAPVLVAGPETCLVGVRARRRDAAAALAEEHGARVFPDADELIAASEVVAIAVPPAVQGELAIRAARGRKPLLLEKPLAESLPVPEGVLAAIEKAGVPNLVTFTYRYPAAVRAFLEDLPDADLTGGRACFFSSAYLGGPFATPWRLEHGPCSTSART
jgi:predicted dehydrogenase